MLNIKKLLTKMLVSLKGKQNSIGITTIARGYNGGASVPANSYKDFTISFGKTFPANPDVVVGFISESTAGAFGRCSCAVHSLTTTGCKIRMFNSDTVSRAPGFEWIAIY